MFPAAGEAEHHAITHNDEQPRSALLILIATCDAVAEELRTREPAPQKLIEDIDRAAATARGELDGVAVESP